MVVFSFLFEFPTRGEGINNTSAKKFRRRKVDRGRMRHWLGERNQQRAQLDLCLCWLKLMDNCSWIFLHQPPPYPPFFSLWCQDHAFSLVLNHLDFHLDVAVICLKYSEWSLFSYFIDEENARLFIIPGSLIPSPPLVGFLKAWLLGARK